MEQLRLRGRRATSSRRAVIEAMESLGQHFSAEEVSQAVRSAGVGRATVYRTLRLLQDEGLLCRVLLEGGDLHYRLTERGHHHHITCTVCGAVRDFSDQEISGVMEDIARREGYSLRGHWIEIYGRCAVCDSRADAAVAARAAGVHI